MGYLYTANLEDEINELEAIKLEAITEDDDANLDRDDADRLESLLQLRSELETEGWHNNVTLIPEDEFTDYAQQLAEDIGAISDETSWPMSCIDWEHAASELAHDYSAVTFDGDTYYYQEA
jgi:hypothetical protein